MKISIKNYTTLFGMTKPKKINHVILSQNKVNGGLKIPNNVNFIYALKCTWIRKILVSPDRPWVRLFESSYCSNNLINYGPLSIIQHGKVHLNRVFIISKTIP